MDNKKQLDKDNLIVKMKLRKVRIITYFDREYPESFKQIHNPPFLFYLRWKIDNSPKVSVVWARKISSYWINIIKNIIPDLSEYFTIVSWGAWWCDSCAHNTTLDSWNKTLSIIWTWIDIDYPIKNRELYNRIVQKWWWVISIFPIWEVGNPYNFPIRNELVATISSWVLIVEAAKKSWTLITANMALDLWKELFVIPWDIFKTNSFGCNNLIKQWNAKLVTCVKDVLEEYNIVNKINFNNKNKKKFDNKIQEEIFNLLLIENLNNDEIGKKLWMLINVISLQLSILEINNYIKRWIWWKYYVC